MNSDKKHLKMELGAVEQDKDRIGPSPKKRRTFFGAGDDSGNGLADSSRNSVLNPSSEINFKDSVKTLGLEDMNRNAEMNLSSDALDLNVGVVSNQNLDLNEAVNVVEEENLQRSNIIDLNLDLNMDANPADLGGSSVVDLGEKVERCFDLNLGLDYEIKGLDVNSEVHLKETISEEETLGREMGGNAQEIRVEEALLGGFTASTETMLGDVIQKELDGNAIANDYYSSENQLMSNGRNSRKRKLADTVLRRSTRRGISSISSLVCVSSAKDLNSVFSKELPSSSVSAVSEEKLAVSSSLEEAEEGQNCLSPKPPELPPSSDNLNLDGIPILEIFSVYSFLRSFSTSLFLSPFKLEDFVAAVRSKTPSLLFDSIHVSLLQTLRKHLEFLSIESSESASRCLRSLNWDLLDLITWPIYMVEYLLMHSPGLKHGINLTQLKLFERGYYKQAESLKIEILQCLCDDIVEAEPIRLELNRRMAGTATLMDLDISKKRRGVDEDESADEIPDLNNDECHLCKMDGNLICCDGCPAAFHSRCVGVVASLLPEGDWFCPECVIEKNGHSMRLGKSIRGAELLGIDPYGRLYYSSCGYLLVSDSCETGSLFRYYHKDDMGAVIEVLKSSYIFCGKILHGITNLCNVNAIDNGTKSYMDLKICNPIILAPMVSSETYGKAEIAPEINAEETYSLNMSGKIEKPLASSEGSTEIYEAVKSIVPNTILTHEVYVNCYSFARIASSIAEKLARKTSDKINIKSAEELVSTQVKVISNMRREFCLSNIQNLSDGVKKEKCGWCFPCKVADDDEERDCLYIANDTAGPVLEGSRNELVGTCLRPYNMKGHLVDVICQILCMEDRLRGLLVGPWLYSDFSKLWRQCVSEATDVVSLKHVLLMLESNLWDRAFSVEWVKHVDTVATVGSASHIVKRLSSKHRKLSKFADPEPNSSAKSASGLTLFWWRGDRVSCYLFNWKVLPHSLVSKAARQGGVKKIPGILYPDGSEYAKRTKNMTWRASVETSRSVEKLALQVRELDANIKWDDIENTRILSKMDKESIKSFRYFKKVIVRRKCSEGKMVKYLLDFGKRRIIPDIVKKHGSVVEESSSEKKKYWLEESHVPLHLLRIFEDKRISRKSNKIASEKFHESGLLRKKPSKKTGFQYLLSKAERSEFCQCSHCEKDVLISDAVSCQYCQGFYHKSHVKRSTGTITAECIYTCHRCEVGKCVIADTNKANSKLQKNKEVNKTRKVSTKSGKHKQSEQTENIRKKDHIVAVPLRRSTRKIKFVIAQRKKKRGRKRGTPLKKVKKAVSMKPKKPKLRLVKKKKRTPVYHAYWLNGLQLSKKPNDERVLVFKREKKLILSGLSDLILKKPRCVLCEECEFTSTLTYIGCEICGGWFHGDAFGLNTENMGNLIGFRCHNCRKQPPPLCPHIHAMIGVETPLSGSNAADQPNYNSERKSKRTKIQNSRYKDW